MFISFKHKLLWLCLIALCADTLPFARSSAARRLLSSHDHDEHDHDEHDEDLFEWAGLFETPEDAYSFILQKVDGTYAETTMSLAVLPAANDEEETLHALEEEANHSLNTTCVEVDHGGSIPVQEDACVELHFNTKLFQSMFILNATGQAHIAIFMQHNPSEFEGDSHYLRDDHGDNIEAVHSLPEPAAVQKDDDHALEVWEQWVYSIAAALVCSLISLAGVSLLLCLSREKVDKIIKPLVAISIGTLLGASFFSLIPETAELVGLGSFEGFLCLLGIFFGFCLDAVTHQHEHHPHEKGDVCEPEKEEDHLCKGRTHSHGKTESVCVSVRSPLATKDDKNKDSIVEDGEEGVEEADGDAVEDHYDNKSRSTVPTFAILNLLGDSLHNLIDGALIAATFKVDAELGIATTLAIAAHELPQEIADFGVLLHAGFSVPKALLANLGVSLTSVLGAVLALAAGGDITNYLLPIAAGLFLYLALVSLLPEILQVQKTRRDRVVMLLFIFIGLGIMALLLLIPHNHAHEEEVSAQVAGHSESPSEEQGHEGHGH